MKNRDHSYRCQPSFGSAIPFPSLWGSMVGGGR